MLCRRLLILACFSVFFASGCGVPIFQNPENRLSDSEVYVNEVRLAEMAEPLGFDSIWGIEHHFTDYTMCPDVVQFLTYMAGKTKKVRLGSQVIVLPWHDPVRVAEQAAVALARHIDPPFTRHDGDIVFAAAVGDHRADLHRVGILARDATAAAIVDACLSSGPAGGLPCARDLRAEQPRA